MKLKRTWRGVLAAGAATFCVMATQQAALAALIPQRVVTLSGDRLPGLSEAEFASFDAPQIDAVGSVGFRGAIRGRGAVTPFGQAVATERYAPLAVIASSFETAPGAGAARFDTFSAVLRSTSPRSAFLGRLQGSGVDASNASGIWSDESGQLDLRVRTGDVLPGAEGTRVGGLRGLKQGIGDGVVFQAILDGAGVGRGNNAGIWTIDFRGTNKVMRLGDAAPGLEGLRYDALLGDPEVSPLGGTLAFRSGLAGEGVDGTNDQALWWDRRGEVELLVRTGDAAVGTGDDVVYRLVSAPLVSDSHEAVFHAQLTGPGVTDLNREGVWVESVFGRRMVIREGDLAPGTDGARFVSTLDRGLGSPFSSLRFRRNGAPGFGGGATAFTGLLVGPDTEPLTAGVSRLAGIWKETEAGLELVARQGEAAPGAGDAVFRDLANEVFALNEAGQIAFSTRLAGNSVSLDNDYGLWASDTEGDLVLLLREGQQLDVGDAVLGTSDLRTVASIAFDAGVASPSTAGGLNESGLVSVAVTFTDDTAAVVILSVPEPATLGLTLGLAGLIGRRASVRVR